MGALSDSSVSHEAHEDDRCRRPKKSVGRDAPGTVSATAVQDTAVASAAVSPRCA